MRSIAEIPPDPLPEGFRLRVALAAANHLSAIRRLVAVDREDVRSVDRLLADAQRFGTLALALTERVQMDLPFWRIQRLLRRGTR